MTDLSSRLEQLSPAKRALLEKLAARAGGPAAAETIRPRDGSGPAPLSFGQQRFWFLDRLQPGTPLYTIPAAFWLRGRLDVRALRAALADVVARHEALRTVFREVEGAPLQLVLPAMPAPLDVADLRALPEAARAAEAERRVRDFLRLPFDLARGPLLRAFAARTDADAWTLALGVHHVASDGWSQGIVLRELAAAYAARAGAEAAPLPAPALQYPDYAVWQRGWLRGRVLEEQLAWWRERLAGGPPVLELPADRPRPAAMSQRGAKHYGSLPAEVAEAAEALARAEGATPFMVLLAAFQLLLGRLAGEDEVRVATPVANRARRETEGTVGFFVNTLVLRGDLSGDPTFRELLARVREETLGAFAHPDLPFERLVEELAPERSLGHAPLAQVSFALQNAPEAALRLPGCEAEETSPDLGVATLDLDVHLRRTARGLDWMARYSTDLWDAPSAALLATRFERLLRGALAAPDARVSTLPLLDAAERARVLEAWNPPARPRPEESVPALFAAQAARTPGAPAVSYGGRTLTYAELHRRALALAGELVARGVGPDARVGLLVERSPEMVVAMLAVLQAGGAYLPLDPDHPAERLAFMLEDAGARVLLAQEALLGRVPEFGGEVVSLDTPHPPAPSPTRGEGESDTSGGEARQRGDSPPPARGRVASLSEPGGGPLADADSLAYVIYTSGSTGRPKGVAVPHRGIVRLVRDADLVAFGPEDRVAQVANAAFDAATWEIWGALLNGGCVVGIDRDTALDARRLAEALRRERVTAMFLTSALFTQTVREAPDAFATVANLVVGGDAVDPAAARLCLEAGAPGRLLNGYGPTENTTFSTWHHIGRVAPDAGTVPIGRAVAGSTAYVLGRALEPVPVGAPGELFVGGWGVARGYLARPELTAERFVPDPFSTEPGARLYRTGDRTRWSARGEIEFLGRMDFQVKIRGFRVEPGEIEAALCAHPAVRAAVVTVREGAGGVPGQPALVGYVAAAGTDAAELRSWVGRTLPEHMVPAAVVVMEALPLTPNGKVDRGALPAPDLASAEEAYVAPRTPEEERVAAILAELLGVERVGATGDFFALGGHSLLAARLVSRIRAETGVELPLRALFEDSTVAALAVRLVEAASAGGVAPASPRPMPRGDGAPLSFAQERLWFIDRMMPGETAYHVPYLLRVRGRLDAAALGRALSGVAARHESLRTVFEERGESAVQAVAAAAPVALPLADLSRLDAAERERTARALAADEAARPFDLARGPLLRASLLRLADDDHALVLTLHHVATDGWSMGVLFRDLSALYAAETGGPAAALPPLPLQYADFAVWQRLRLRGDALERELGYWRERLDGAPALLELPTDRPRRPARGRRGARVEVAVPADAAAALRALARAEGSTPFMALLAGFQLLLSRWAGQDDVVVGTPIAGRTHRELEELVGFFVNTLAVRGELGDDPTGRDLLRRTRTSVLGAFEHQEVPFERLVEELKVERSLAHTPVFQAMFAVQDAAPRPELAGAAVEVEELWTGRAKFDVSVALRGGPSGYTGSLAYDADLFDGATAARMAAHFGRALAALAAAPDARLSALALLDDAERRQVLAAWNPPLRPRPEEPVHALFAAQAARTPAAPAVSYGGETLTYAELQRRALALAGELAARGVGPDARVGLLVERSPDMVVAMLAVLQAGGAYVPLDPDHPSERLAFMLDDAGARVLLAQEALLGRVPEFAGEVVSLDTPHPPAPSPTRGEGENDTSGGEARQRGDSPPPERGRVASLSEPGGGLSADSLAYVIYTSGSTGRPKGVAVPHRGIVRLVRDADLVAFGPGDRVAQVANAAFDAATWEIWGALLNGGCVVGIDRDTALDARRLAEALRRERVTAMFLTSALFTQTVREAPDAFATVANLVAGGDAVDPAAARLCLEAGAPGRLLNGYGPTENTTFSTWHHIARVAADAGTVPIGRAVAGSTAYVLGRALEPVPVGAPGELFVGGWGVARGYLGRPELTAERFAPDPFSTERGARLYRTGDRTRWSARGEIEFLGRMDFQVKIRGFRVEPGEIEATLCEHPAVRAAVVTVREGAGGVPGQPALVGYVAAAGTDAAELRAWVGRTLPEHMVPAAMVVMEALPLTPNGKVDRGALPDPEWTAGDEYVAPRTPDEEIVAGILAELLGVERVGATDDFFALGGHSLLATRVVSRVRAVLGSELPLRAVFEAPTAAGIAERVRLHRGDAAPPVVPVPRDGPLPLSFSQERLWFMDRMEPVNAHHNITFALRLEGPLDAVALRGALAEIVRRHEALRTVFREVDGLPSQVVLPHAALRLPCVDLDGLPEPAREAAMQGLALAEMRRPTDLEAGPLARTTLVRMGPEHHALVLMIHHSVADAWSFGVLYRELGALYTARVRGASSPLAPLPVQYGDYAAWQRAWLTGETLERQLGFWRDRLAGAPALLDLPTDRPRPALQTHRAATYHAGVSAETAARLRALDRREGVTPFMSFLAALCVLLRRRSGQDDVVVGTPIAGRTRAETEGLIGFFVNMLALRTELGGDPGFRELLGRVRETTLGAYSHQDVPFERLLEELKVQRSLAHSSVYQVMLVLHNAEVEPPRLPGLRATGIPVQAQATPFDLSLVVAQEPDGRVRTSFTYNADLFDEATIASFGAQLGAILEDAAADPDRPLSRLAPVLEEERALHVERWNATERVLPSGRPVHDLVREAALRTPDAPAVAQEGAAPLTHAGLDRRAEALAAHLATLGVGPETRVALCLERSPEMLVAMLAVLKAGGCYVPVDPAYPADRIQYMLDDSGARVLLTQERLVGTLPEFGGEVVAVDGSALSHSRTFALSHSPSPDSAAYVIYTSGSTGRPKGVVVPHRALANYAAAAVELYGITPSDRVLQFASLSFDASAEEIYPALLGGASLVLRTEEMLTDAATFFRRCVEWGVTVLDLPTAYWHELVAELERGAVRLPESVRLVIIGGERALPERVAAWRRSVGDGVRLVNTYGPTEATVVATLAELQGREEAPPLADQPLPSVPIGGPVPNGRAYVLDGEMRPLPIGARGELYVGGMGVARGYLGRPELTAEKFVPDPFSVEPGARLYRTGDVVRWRRMGELEFVGRADDQVKVRGFRIELGEIEDLLLRHPAVRDAVVAAREDEPGRTRLVGYVVPADPAGAPSVADLRAHLKAELPEYMVPAAFVVLDALPKTGSGKVDRRALPVPDAPAVPAESYVAPETEAERRLAEIWAEVLRVERVGTRDDFFALGGHSLLATQVISRVRQAFGAELPLRAVFERPTVGELAALLPAEDAGVVRVPADMIIASDGGGMEDELLDRIDELSDAEIERLLAGLSPDTGIGA